MTSAAICQPTRSLRAYVHGVRKRLYCGWITGHVPDDTDGFGYYRCLLCNTWMTG